MNIKYRSGYAEGGFLDDGAAVDPISGNEVPAGSLAEEVRDDVPAQLSEGEFVVPADVVRFIGLEKLMQMRDQAKSGLAQMESEGQMGGSPAPMQSEMDDATEMDALIDGMDSEDFDGAVQAFAEGGSVLPSFMNYFSRDADPDQIEKDAAAAKASTTNEMPSYATYMGQEFNENTTIEYTKYTNEAGDVITVKTLKGKPLEEVPEGYYVVGSENTEEAEDTGDAGAVRVPANDSKGGGGEGERDRNYQNSTQRTNEENKSLRITQERSSVLNGLHKDNMSLEEVDTLFASMTPMAQAEYDNRFRDPKYVDKYMSEGKSPVELMLIAQKTVDLRNRMNGNLEPNSAIIPTGEPVTLEGTLEGLYKVFTATQAGMKALKELGKEGVKKLILGEDKRKGNNTQPSVTAKPTQYNQAHWRDRMGELAKAGVSAEDIQTQLLTEQQSVAANSGGTVDAYGNKIMREPGQPAPRTVWDDIAEVKRNQQATIDINLKRVQDAEALLQNDRGFTPPVDVEDAVDGTEYQPEGSGITGGMSNRENALVTPSSPNAVEAPSEDPVVTAIDMGSVTASDQWEAMTSPDDLDKLVSKEDEETFQAKYDAQLEKQLDENANFFDDVALTSRENALVKPATTATLGATGTLGTPAASSSLLPAATSTGLGEPDEAAIRDLATSLGVDPQEMVDRWKADTAENSSDPFADDPVRGLSKRQQDELDREEAREKERLEREAEREQARIDREEKRDSDARDRAFAAVERKEKQLADELKAKNAQAAQDLADQQRRQQSQSTVNSGGGDNPNKGNNSGGYSGGGGGGAAGKGAGTAKSGYSFGLAQGGLVAKNKPKIKKMPKDNTTGLAAKKKSKEKAKAKKGALAAKRT